MNLIKKKKTKNKHTQNWALIFNWVVQFAKSTLIKSYTQEGVGGGSLLAKWEKKKRLEEKKAFSFYWSSISVKKKKKKKKKKRIQIILS